MKIIMVLFVVLCFPFITKGQHNTAPASCESSFEVMVARANHGFETELRLAKCLPKHFFVFANLKVSEHKGFDAGLKFQVLHQERWELNLFSGLDHLSHKDRLFVGAEAEVEARRFRLSLGGTLGGHFGRALEFGIQTPKLKWLGNVRLGPVVRFTPHGTQFLAKVSRNF